MTAREQIINNPYRTLGVYVGDSLARESSNRSKISAYSKVGKSLEMPMRSDDLLGPVKRTAQTAADASQMLSMPKDRIKYALVWFADSDEPWAAHLNKAVDSIIDDRLYDAVICYSMLICDNGCRTAFVNAATHGLNVMDRAEMVNVIIDLLQIQSSHIEEYLLYENFEDAERSRQLLQAYIGIDDLMQTVRFADDSSDVWEMLTDFKGVIGSAGARLQKLHSVLEQNDHTEDKYREAAVNVANAIYKRAKQILVAWGKWVWDKEYTITSTLTDVAPRYKLTTLKPYAAIQTKKVLGQIESMVSASIASIPGLDSNNGFLRNNAYQYEQELELQYYNINSYNESPGLKAKIRTVLAVVIWLAILVFFVVRLNILY